MDPSLIQNLTPEFLELLKEANHTVDLLVQENQELVREKKALDAQIQTLQGEKVTLQKVASGRSPIDVDRLQEAVTTLVAAGFLPEDQREKLASECAEDPNRLIDVVHSFSAPLAGIHGQGFGVEKGAFAHAESDPDGWDAVVNEGR